MRLNLKLFFLLLGICTVIPFLKSDAEACCRHSGDLGPVGNNLLIGGNLITPDGIPKSGAIIRFFVNGEERAIACAYTADGTDSGCDNAHTGVTHTADVDPYYLIKVNSIVPELMKNETLLHSFTTDVEVSYTDEATGRVYLASGTYTVSPEAFNQNKVLRIDISVKEHVIGTVGDETDWETDQFNGVTYADGRITLNQTLTNTVETPELGAPALSAFTPMQPEDIPQATGSSILTTTTFADLSNADFFRQQIPALNPFPSPDLCVHPEGNDANDCSCSTGNYCQSVQRAVNVAEAGQVIAVAEGEYKYTEMGTVGERAMAEVSKSLIIAGGWNSSFTINSPIDFPTTLNAEYKSRVIMLLAESSIFDGFIITHGLEESGGGISLHRPDAIIINSIIKENKTEGGFSTLSDAVGGAGILLYGSSTNAQIINSKIISNTSHHLGGAILGYRTTNTTILNVDISDNFSALANISFNNIPAQSEAPKMKEISLKNNLSGHQLLGGIQVTGGTNLLLENIVIRNSKHSIIQSTQALLNELVFDKSGLKIITPDSIVSNITVINETMASGAGINIYGDSLDVFNVLSTGNRTTDGAYAGIQIDADNSIFDTLTSTNNYSHGTFSGISAVGSNNKISNVNIVGNVHNGYGGGYLLDITNGLYIKGDGNTIHKANIIDNTSVASSFRGHTSGLNVYGNNNSLSELLIQNNSDGAKFLTVTLQGNTITNLYSINNEGYIDLNGSVVFNNLHVTHHNGSVLFDIDANDVQLNGAIISDNQCIHCIDMKGDNFLVNNLMAVNNAYSTFLNMTGSGDISHSTIAKFNLTRRDGTAIRVLTGQLSIRNSIISGHNHAIQGNTNSFYDTKVTNSNFWDNGTLSSGTVIFTSSPMLCNPRFVDPENGDYRLAADPNIPTCVIDQGTPIDGLDTDIKGAPRIGLPDIGADEFGSSPPRIEGNALTRIITPTAGFDWHTVTLETSLPARTGAQVTLLDSSGAPIHGYTTRRLNDGPNTLDLSELDPTTYPSLQIQVDFLASNTDQVPALTDWQLDWLIGDSFHPRTAGAIFDGYRRPIPHTKVVLLENGIPIATTTTDDSGKYLFKDLPLDPKQSYQVRVALTDNLGETPRYQTRYAANDLFGGPIPYLQTPPFTYEEDTIFMTENHNFDFRYDAYDYQTNIPNKNHLDDLAVSFVEMGRVVDFIYTELGETLSTIDVNLFASGANHGRVFYSEDNRTIIIGADHSMVRHGSRPMNREWHEMTHALHDLLVGIPHDSCDPSHNHGGYDNCSTTDSYTEGLAIFLATAVADKEAMPNPEIYRLGNKYGQAGISLEINWKAWDRACSRAWCYSREEFASASLFRDLNDAPLIDDDPFAIPIATLWAIFKNPAIKNMGDLYEALKAANIGQDGGSNDACALTALDELFVDHGFFVDGDDSQSHSCDEEVGRAADSGRTDRGSAPVTAQHIELTADLPASDTPLPVQVAVTFPDNPALGYSYNTETIDGRIIIEPLPADSEAQIVVTVENEELISINPLVIENDDYVAVLDNATAENSTLLDHNFNVVERPESETVTVELPLLTGWQLISLSVVAESTEIAAVFASIDGKYDRLYLYDGCQPDAPWATYNRNIPTHLNTLTDIDHTQGLWVHMTENATLTVSGTIPLNTSMTLCPGPNLVGYPQDLPQSVATLFSGDHDQLVSIYSYNSDDPNGDVWKRYAPDAPTPLNDLSELTPQKGYWITVKQNIVWSPSENPQ